MDALREPTDIFGEDPTNLDKLHPDLRPYIIEKGTLGGPMLKHPLVNEIFFVSWKLANQQYEAKRERIAALLDAGDYHAALWFYERPWRITTLEQWWKDKEITREQLRSLLTKVWIDCEMPSQYGRMPLRLFRATGFITDIDGKDELGDFLLPKQAATVYRGCGQGYRDGISWTKSPQRAGWFARRFARDGGGQVWMGEVEPRYVLGIFLARGEEEVVVDPRRLTNLREALRDASS